ncbi:hypothetical protein D3C76_1878270 [compost metagenome]
MVVVSGVPLKLNTAPPSFWLMLYRIVVFVLTLDATVPSFTTRKAPPALLWL